MTKETLFLIKQSDKKKFKKLIENPNFTLYNEIGRQRINERIFTLDNHNILTLKNGKLDNIVGKWNQWCMDQIFASDYNQMIGFIWDRHKELYWNWEK